MSRHTKAITKLYNCIEEHFPGNIKPEDEFLKCIDVAITIIKKSQHMLNQKEQVAKAFEDVARINWMEQYIGDKGVAFRKTLFGKGIVIKKRSGKGSFKTIRDAVDIISLSELKLVDQNIINKDKVVKVDQGAKK